MATTDLEARQARAADPGRPAASQRRRRLLALCIAAMLGLVAVVVAEGSNSADRSRAQYRAQQASLSAALAQATADGYTRDEVQPVTAARAQLESREAPLWVADRPVFYQGQAQAESSLRQQLAALEADILQRTRQDAAARLKEASDRIAEATTLGAEAGDLKPLQAEYDSAARLLAAARTVHDLRTSAKVSEGLAAKAADLGAAQRAELAAIQKVADGLAAQPAEAVAAAARDSLANARNEATVATWLKESGFDRAYRQLEKYAAMLPAADRPSATTGAAGVQRYAQQIHDALVRGMPAKSIVISMQGQHLYAYQGATLVQETLVTTGRPPELATDIGPMKVLWKQAPWKMHSPWPKESPYWYPDTKVERVVWFTNTGEGLHDASWQPDGTYGPGSQYGPSASHGCVHVPPASEVFLYDWADPGTPVIVYPGTGQTLQAQLAQKTTDDDGNPFTGPKGA